MTTWVEVLVTMTDGPSLPIRGVVRRTSDEPENLAFMGGSPIFVGIGDAVRIWRDGAKVRIETLGEQPLFVTDGETAWKFDGTEQPPLRGTIGQVRYLGTGREVVFTRNSRDWVGDDYARPAGPIREVEFLGRNCWVVDLAPPPRKEGLLRLLVDRASGAVLSESNTAGGHHVAYTEVTVGEPIDPAVFTWTGPSRDVDEEGRSRGEERRREHESRLDWFRIHVADELPTLRIPTALRLERMLELDEDTGAFQAAIGAGATHLMLARRPASDQPWVLRRAHGTIHRWSTDGFDWAVNLPDGELDAESLGVLQHALTQHTIS
ncbi:hypothetical protein [Prescottella subtropica]|uniref:hypothetical protein n=1 Tax=Prescottella subtropica TaxID=2545757 RepID=UPI0010F5B0B8|nr:hypothetical protein [Prescottella subtropica]